MTDEATRTGRIIAEVVAAEVRRTGCRGVVLASPPGPEAALLGRWLGETLPLRRPDAGAVSDVAGALAAGGAPGRHVEALAWQVVAAAQGLAQDLLLLGATNKTVLLLEDAPLPARVLPLGDLWASDVARWIGDATVPTVVGDPSHGNVAIVDASLRAYLVEGVAPEVAFGPLGGDAPRIRAALDAAERRRRGLVVPKLEAWTAGIDLAR
jgi:hypothetical protein